MMRLPELPEIRKTNLRNLALTHKSFANENNCPDNERLEFLGDAILGFIVSDLLYRTDPPMNEGDMTDLRAELVNKSMLAAFASHFHLGDRLYLGRGEKQSGGRDNDKILGDAFEAYIGALYLDSGLETVRSFIELRKQDAEKAAARNAYQKLSGETSKGIFNQTCSPDRESC